MSKKRIWLLSAYQADSHARWAAGLIQHHRDLDWQCFELPGRHFSWRIRGNPLSWLDRFEPGQINDAWPDALIATSMVDLATIRGLHPRLASVPTLVYFHENQFAYPKSDRQTTSVDAQMVQLYAALAADRVAFNSGYNRQTFLDGVDALMRRMPDRVPTRLRERLEAKSEVLPVPVAPVRPGQNRDPERIVWNHRWEYDKAPDLFVDAMIGLAERGVNYRLALLGPSKGASSAARQRLRDAVPERIVIEGALPTDAYRQQLGQASIVVSTALHEFQGLSVLEAVSAGCVPLVPDALCYPEIYPAHCRYCPGDRIALENRLNAWLTGDRPSAPDVDAWTGKSLRSAWHDTLMRLVRTPTMNRAPDADGSPPESDHR